MIDIRCSKCNKKLAVWSENSTTIPNEILENITTIKGIGKDACTLDIKCPRCKEVNRMIV